MKLARISISTAEEVDEKKPDYVFMELWVIKDEIVRRLGDVQSWIASFS